jgi:ceramide glucosyltransferase
MSLHLVRIASIIAALGALASLGYYALCLWSAARFLREQKSSRSIGVAAALPPVSILKPLKGADPEMYGCLRSHCLQNYPEYEIIFGVIDKGISQGNDPAIQFVERLKAEFPQHSIRLVLCGKNLGANAKVSNLAQMLTEARYEHLLVNDSDIRVEPDYLRRVLAPLADPKIGLVTCLYRGLASPTFGSRLEALGISTDFAAGVLVAQQLENGIRFGLGSTLAFRRRDLQAIGGFEELADYLGDDYEIGRRIAMLDLKVELSDVVVETFLPPYRLSEFLQHQLRWARNIRDARRAGYFGLGVTFGIPWALLALAFSRSAHSLGTRWAWALLAVVVAMRLVTALVVGYAVLRDRQVFRSLWMLPLRDCVALGIWLAGFAGHKIIWRGETFELRNGKLIRPPLKP